jgi:hypothetical protein
MRRHFVALATLLVQPHPSAFAIREIILDQHTFDQRAGLIGREHRSFSALDDARRSSFRSQLVGHLGLSAH